MEEETKTKFKFKCVLFELLKDDYKVTDDTVFEKLITHLSDGDKGSHIIDVPVCLGWIRSVMLSWHQGKSSANIMSFALRLLAIIVEGESNYLSIQNTITSPSENAVHNYLAANNPKGCAFLQILGDACSAACRSSSNYSVKCAVIQFLSSLLKHASGRQWILCAGLWRDIHTISIKDSSIYVIRDSRRFLSNLLNGMPTAQESETETIFTCILQPILAAKSFAELPPDDTEVLASFYLVSEIIQNIFPTAHPETNKMLSPLSSVIFKATFNLLAIALDAVKTCKNVELEEMASKISVLMFILGLIKDGGKVEGLQVKAICLQILDVFNDLINKGSVENILKLCVTCHNYWPYVGKVHKNNEPDACPLIHSNDNKQEDEKRYRFEDQLLCLQLAPIFCLIVTTPAGTSKELYLCKLADKICIESQRLVFSFRNMVLRLQKLQYWLTMSVRCVICLTKLLTRLTPMCVGCTTDPAVELYFEAYLQSLTSLVHNTVTRMVYAFRTAIVKHSCNEGLASLAAASIQSVKHFINRNGHSVTKDIRDKIFIIADLTPLCVGCTMGDSTLESYFQIQVSKRLEVNTMRSIYSLRDIVVENRHLMDRSALQSVATLSSLSGSGVDPDIERERAVLVFQSFIYVLKHFVQSAESETKQGGWGGEFRQSHHSTLLVAILDGLTNLVRSHRITWRESVESLCLLTLAQELLDSPTFSSKAGLVVQGLQLIQLCIENFMPPNLALLTNSLSGTGLEHLGPLIFKRLHDPHWEVRDSSLEVVLTLAKISHTKYPLFQELIRDNKLCEVVVHLSSNDAESYVCATATKCLTAMVKVDRLWNEELSDKDLVGKMIGILNGESEGVLRREASLLMSEILKYRKVPPDTLQKMCLTMANVVLSDLHWEVKVNALGFWELIIEHQMNDQGMIDGMFPQVTFSKEHRKIITLTPAAIQERLKKVLGELSQNGCLHVLLEAIYKDEDLEVVKKASQIISSLTTILESHGLLSPKSLSTSASTISEAPALSSSKPVANDVDLLPGPPQSAGGRERTAQTKGELFSSLHSKEYAGQLVGKSILDLDPQTMGFAALNDDGNFHSIPEGTLQEKVIDSILNDKDINLLAKVYLGTEAEAPGRQGPETKVSRPVRPLVILSSDEFLHHLSMLDIDEIVNERTRWIEDTGGNLETLLDDMLICRDVNLEDGNDCNAMDCY